MKKKLFYFTSIVILLAFMDGFNFYFPHNEGWSSLTYGEGSNNLDIWHLLKRLILLILFVQACGIKLKKPLWWFYAIIFTLIAYFGQVLIYDVFIKLL